MSLDGFSMYPLILELDQQLSGGRIDKIHQPNQHTVILAVRQPGKTFSLHISINPQNPVINIITRTIDNPAAAPLFCMVLRKQIEDGRIAAIRQHGLDRMVVIDIDVLGAGGIIQTKSLVIELMGKYSNLILLQDEKIIDAMKKIGAATSRVRQILPGLDYRLPPNQDKINVLTSPISEMAEKLQDEPQMPLVKAIIRVCLGIGPTSAKEFAWGAGLPGDIAVQELSAADMDALSQSAQEIIDAFHAKRFTPTVVTDEHKKLLAVAAFPLHHLRTHTTHILSSMSEAVDFSTTVSGNYTIPEKEQLKKFAANESAKLRHKLEVITQELSDAYNAEDYKVKADILMTYQYQFTAGYATQEIELPNIYADVPEAHKIKIALDPRLSAAQNMQAYYAKYNKLKRAQELLQVQIEQCKEDMRYIASIESSLESSSTLVEIHEIKRELIAAGYITEQKKRKASEKPSLPFKFTSSDGDLILVGKNNFQNDQLTFKTAMHDDMWLHAKDIPGSHVVIRCERQTPSENTLHLAATLAAYFSKARDSSNVPVDCTKQRYVKKPAKAKPGFVIYTNQKTLYVTPDKETIEQMLENRSKSS